MPKGTSLLYAVEWNLVYSPAQTKQRCLLLFVFFMKGRRFVPRKSKHRIPYQPQKNAKLTDNTQSQKQLTVPIVGSNLKSVLLLATLVHSTNVRDRKSMSKCRQGILEMSRHPLEDLQSQKGSIHFRLLYT